MIHLSKERKTLLQEIIGFGIVGVSNTIVFYVIYLGTLLALQHFSLLSGTDYLIAQIVGFVLSVLWSFYWNNRFVFTKGRESRNWLHALAKTYASYAFTGLFLNSILAVLWVEFFHLSKVYAPVLNVFINVPINFILNKCWAFRKGKD